MPRVLFLVVSILILSSVCQASQYTVVPLIEMPWVARPLFINDSSQIAGVDFHTLYFKNQSKVTSYSFPSNESLTELNDMSESGIVVGIANSRSLHSKSGFASVAGQAPTYLPFYPNGITETDVVVGASDVMDFGSGITEPVNDWLGIDNYFWSVYDANDAKQAVGYSAVDTDNPQVNVWDGLTMHSLPLQPNEHLKKANINTLGQVVAAVESYDPTGITSRSSYWDTTHGFVSLDGIEHPSNLPLKSVIANGISNTGQIVGTAAFESGYTITNKCFTWSAVSGYSWLPDEYIPYDVNSDGLIAAYYGYGPVLLVPVPEPGGMLVMAGGMMGLLAVMRRKV